MREMPASLSAAAHSSKTASPRRSRVLMVGSPRPTTIRSPLSVPFSISAAVSSVVLNR